MKNKVNLVPATLPIATYVAAYARKRDQIEHDALYDCPLEETAAMAYYGSLGWSYAALISGNPAFVFGVVQSPDQPHMGVAWGYGTNHTWRTIPRVSEFIQNTLKPSLIDNGLRRVEVRALASNSDSVRWLTESMGANYETILPEYGRNGELFVQFAWTHNGYSKTYVPFQDPETGSAG